MAIQHYYKATMHLILQIGISQDTECVNTVGFPKSGHIYTYIECNRDCYSRLTD